MDISCSVVPAVIFYNVYECGTTDEEQATKDVDTSAAGANVIIADGSENHVSGSYVARIYESYELSEDGTEVVDSKKLHKYDGAFYSKMSMNVDGGEAGTGILNITAKNEGLDSGLHLTINGGNLNIIVDRAAGEGDGIDSNGWLVINGGTIYSVKDDDDTVLVEFTPGNDFTYFIISSADLAEGTYSVWMGETQLAGALSEGGMAGPGMGGMPRGGEQLAGMERPEGTEGQLAVSEEASIEFVVTAGGNYYNNVMVAN